MDFGIYAGDTNKTIYVRLRDSTTGLAKTGLVYNSAGAVCSYTLPLAARAAITLATQTVTGAHSDGGFVEVDATNCKGLYRLDLSDAAIASGDYTIISIEFDGIIEESILIPLHTRKVNATQIGSQTASASGTITFPNATLASTTNITAGTITTTTNLTNAPTSGDLTATMKTSVNTEIDTALADIGLDHLIFSALPTNWATDVASGSVFDNIADDGTAAYDRTTDSLQAVRDHVADGTNLTEAGGTGDQFTGIPTLPAALVGGRIDANIGAISTSTTAADNLEASALGIVPGACEGTPSTTVIQTDLAETTDDHYIGRVVVFTSGNAAGEATDITDYTGSTGTLTVTALQTAPAAADTFVIV